MDPDLGDETIRFHDIVFLSIVYPWCVLTGFHVLLEHLIAIPMFVIALGLCHLWLLVDRWTSERARGFGAGHGTNPRQDTAPACGVER